MNEEIDSERVSGRSSAGFMEEFLPLGRGALPCLHRIAKLTLFAVLVWAAAVAAQERPAVPTPAQDEGAAETEREISSILSAAADMAAKNSDLKQGLGKLFRPETAAESVQELSGRLAQLADRLEAIEDVDDASYDQVAALRGEATAEKVKLKQILEESAKAVGWLERARSSWMEEQKRWEEWATRFPAENRSNAMASAFQQAGQTVGRALAAIDDVLQPLMGLQGKVAELELLLGSLEGQADELLRTLRGRYLHKAHPSLFSPAYFRQLQTEGFWRFLENLGSLSLPATDFLTQNGWLLLVYLLLVAVVATGLHRKRQDLEAWPRWRFLGEYPVATAFLLATAAVFLLLAPIPPILRVALLAVAGGAVSRMIRGVFEDAGRRRMVNFLILIALFTSVLRVIGVPSPLLRLYLLFLVLLGLPLCSWRVRVNVREGAPWWRVWLYRSWVGVLCVMGAANLGGYSALASHVLLASLYTTLVGVFVWMLSLTSHGALQFALSEGSPLCRLPLVRRNVPAIRKRSELAVNAIAVVLGLVLTLRVWQVYSSAGTALLGLFSLGITLGSYRLTLGLVLGAALALYGSLLLSSALQDVLMHDVYPNRKVHWGVRFSVNRLLHYALVLIGFVVSLGVLGFDLQNVTILAGALGVGIGFGLQTIVNNFVSGLILLFERPIKVGDIVQMGTQWGLIKSIGLRATVVETFDRSEIIVPNSDLVSSQVTNWTLGARTSRVIIPVGIAYGSDVPLAMSILQEVAAANPMVMEDPEPQVLFLAFGTSSLDLELRVWVADVDNRLLLTSELHQEIDRRFREARVEIAFPQRDLHLRTVDERARGALASALHLPREPGGLHPQPEGARSG